MKPGVPSVMDSGQPMMQTWPADSLDMQTVVCMQESVQETLHLVLHKQYENIVALHN